MRGNLHVHLHLGPGKLGRMHVRIEGHTLPGRTAAPRDAHRCYPGVHVAVQLRKDPWEPVPADAESAEWSFDVTTRPGDDGGVDVGGPYVHGRKGDRFLYLTWGAVDDKGGFEMFRRAKLHFADVGPDLLRQAATDPDATLVARLGLTDGRGDPLCARVRPPVVTWSVSR